MCYSVSLFDADRVSLRDADHHSYLVTEKKTYRKPEWPLYNLAQTEEKRRFLVLLHDLCRGLPDPVEKRAGKKRTAMADMVFSCVLKVYSCLSSRRFGTDLDEATLKGYVSRKMHPGMTWAFLENKLLTPVLKDLVVRSSLPLCAIETTFAPDSTGFSTSRFIRWFDEKYGRHRSGKNWVKAHAMCGVKTHVVTALEIHDRDAADSPQFKALVEKTAEHFTVKEVPCDKAYLSRENLEIVDRLGGTAYIPFKVNSVAGEAGTLWEKMFHFYSLHREEFLRKYHQRSNAESAFSMTKAKFGDSVRSRTNIAMKNEVFSKFIAHNACCVLMSQVELGIEPMFWGKSETDSAATNAMPAAASAVPTATAEQKTVDSVRGGWCAGA
jgi:transposase